MSNRVRLALLVLTASCVQGLGAQETPQDTLSEGATPPSEAVAPEGGGLPIVLTVGMGYGQRFDPCAHCTNPQNVQSFTGHLGLGKYLWRGLAVGVDASVWRRSHPGTPPAADSLGTATPTKLMNQLGNVSLSFSYEAWHVFVRGGVGVALAQQDIQDLAGDVSSASGMGVGYSVGGGVMVPLASMVSLVFFGNWNAGGYDLSTPSAMIERGVRHEYVELGFGLTTR